MDYLIGVVWPLWVLGLIANRHHITKHEPPEFIEEDELCVISNDTDEVVFTGCPAAVYDWLQIYQGTSAFDVYDWNTRKTVTSSYFKSKYVDV